MLGRMLEGALWVVFGAGGIAADVFFTRIGRKTTRELNDLDTFEYITYQDSREGKGGIFVVVALLSLGMIFMGVMVAIGRIDPTPLTELGYDLMASG